MVLVGLAFCLAVTGARAASEKNEEDGKGIRRWEDIQSLYEKAKETGEKVPEWVGDWVKEEFRRVGTWEYRIVSLEPAGADLEERFNALGQDRWEIFWLEREGRTLRVFLKRPARTVIQSLPAAEILKRLRPGPDARRSPE